MKTTNTATAAKMPPTRKFAACWKMRAWNSSVTEIWEIAGSMAEINYSIVVPLYNEQDNVLPLYLRKSDAELAWDRKDR